MTHFEKAVAKYAEAYAPNPEDSPTKAAMLSIGRHAVESIMGIYAECQRLGLTNIEADSVEHVGEVTP